MKKKYKILFIASWYPTKELPANGDFIQRHAKAVSLFADVTVLHISSATQNKKFFIEDIMNENIREIRIFHKKVNLKISLLKNIFNLFIKFKAFIHVYKKLGKVDLVHLNVMFPAGLFALYLNRRFSIPFIITEHWSKFLPDSKEHFTKMELFMIRLIMRNASFICPVSNNLKMHLQKLYTKSNFKVIPNVVDTNIFYPLPKRPERKQAHFIHVSGMIDEIKNISGIIRAVKIATTVNPDFRLTFVGNDNVEEYKNYVHKLKIPKYIIKFAGEVSYSKVAELMREHDVLLMFSNYENLPCVIAEALVSGLPVLSSKVGGIPEMIDETNGILVEKQNEEQLAEKILEIISQYPHFNREAIARKAKSLYSYKVVGKAYFDLYRNILEPKNV